MSNDAPQSIPPGAASHPPRRWQFSLRAMLVLTFAVAVGFSTARWEDVGWPVKTLIGVGALLVLGLLAQAFDLARESRRRTDLSSDRRWAWRFAVAWRIVVAGYLVGYYVFLQLTPRTLPRFDELSHIASVPNNLFDRLFVDEPLTALLPCLALLIILESVHTPPKPRTRTRFSRIVAVVGVMVAVAWCLYAVVDSSCIGNLIFMAVHGIELCQPLPHTAGAAGLEMIRGLGQFMWANTTAMAAVLLGGVCLMQLARRWERGRARRVVWGMAAMASLAGAAFFDVWWHAVGLKRLSPAFAEGLGGYQTTHLVVVGVAAISLATILAWRMARRTVAADLLNNGDRQTDSAMYIHQSLVVMAAVAMGTGMVIAVRVADALGPKPFGLASPSTWEEMIGAVFYTVAVDTCGLLISAVFLLSLRVLWQRLRRLGDLASPKDFAVSPGCFAAVWLGALAWLVTAAPVVAWFGIAIWQLPPVGSFW